MKTLPPFAQSLPPLVSRGRDPDGHSAVAEPWRAWYATAAWRALRLEVFDRDGWTCRMPACEKVIARPVADHITPHRGDPVLFWDKANLQTLCKPCHDGAKQRAERAARGVL